MIKYQGKLGEILPKLLGNKSLLIGDTSFLESNLFIVKWISSSEPSSGPAKPIPSSASISMGEVEPSPLLWPSVTIAVLTSFFRPTSNLALSPPLYNFIQLPSLSHSSGILFAAPAWCSSLHLLSISCRVLSHHSWAIHTLLCALKSLASLPLNHPPNIGVLCCHGRVLEYQQVLFYHHNLNPQWNFIQYSSPQPDLKTTSALENDWWRSSKNSMMYPPNVVCTQKSTPHVKSVSSRCSVMRSA